MHLETTRFPVVFTKKVFYLCFVMSHYCDRSAWNGYNDQSLIIAHQTSSIDLSQLSPRSVSSLLKSCSWYNVAQRTVYSLWARYNGRTELNWTELVNTTVNSHFNTLFGSTCIINMFALWFLRIYIFVHQLAGRGLARNIWLNYEGPSSPQPENAYGESERLGLVEA